MIKEHAKSHHWHIYQTHNIYGNSFNILNILFLFSAKNIQICSRHEPKLSECILNSVKQLQPRLASGRLDDEFIVPVR